MRFFKLSDDEIMVFDGKKSVLIMARDGNLPPKGRIELEGHHASIICEDCPNAGLIFRALCDEPCPKEVQPR